VNEHRGNLYKPIKFNAITQPSGIK
jgi:hypothetical protein